MNNTEDLEHLNVHEEYLIFKGVFFELAPVTIPLCLIVLVQNTVLFVDYYREKAKLVPSFFMGIALADILKAQGELVLALISVFVYTGVCNVEVLYRSLLYYMVTALPGVNCSKVLNLTMTLTLTINVVNPFRRIDAARVRKVMFLICLIVTCLHFLDTIIFVIARWKVFMDDDVPPYMYDMAFYYLMLVFQFPGSVTIAAILCSVNQSNQVHAECGYEVREISGLVSFLAVVYLAVPPLIVLVCMAIQIKYLRQGLQDPEASQLLPNPARHVSITVLIVSLLFFVCNIAYLVVCVMMFSKFYVRFRKKTLPDDDYVDLGVFQGVTEFILPLIYAAVYPVILVSRKPELRERYWRGLTRVLPCCLYDVITTSRDVITTARDAVTTPRDVITTPRDVIATPRDVITTPRDVIATPRDVITAPRDVITTPRDVVTAPRDVITTPRDVIATPRDVITAPRDAITTPRDVIATPRDVITTPRDLITTPCDAITAPRDVIKKNV